MTAEQAVAFLEGLRATQIRVKDNGWIEATCPLARWLHKHHTDHSPSFGLSVVPGGRSFFLCFACRQGSAEELLHSIEMYAKNTGDYDFARCHQILADEQFVVPLPAYGEFPKPEQVFTPWPEYRVESFKRAEWVVESALYLASRGVSIKTIEQFDLRFDPKRQMVIAPYRDVFYRLAGARGRSILDHGQKHYDYTFQGVNNARFCWYNEQVLNQSGPVVVVEGQFDVFKVSHVFPKTVGNLTSKPTMEKMKKLGDCGLVIQIPDRDEAGEASVGRYASLCQTLGLYHKVIWLDPGCKDPGECHVDYLRDRINACT